MNHREGSIGSCRPAPRKWLHLYYAAKAAAWALVLPLWAILIYSVIRTVLTPLLQRDALLAYLVYSLTTAVVTVAAILLALRGIWSNCCIARDPYRWRLGRMCDIWARAHDGACVQVNEGDYFLRVSARDELYGRIESFLVGRCRRCGQPTMCGVKYHTFKVHGTVALLSQQLDEMLEELALDYPSGPGC